jgi:hypothetical protein
LTATDPRAGPRGRLRASIAVLASHLPALDVTLFLLALALFLVTRLVRLERFPIYFFTDEAVQTVLAADFLRHGLRDKAGRLLPTYFQNGVYYNLSVSVYLQAITYKLFGFSIFWTRATSALVALTGTAAVGLTLRDVFRLRYWWAGTLLLSLTPAWFLHSRTAFETVIAVSFYAWTLYFYLLYRHRHPLFLLPALVMAALAFYSYAASQFAIVATAGLLGVSDLRYHWRHRKVLLAGALVVAVMALPYVRFRLSQPDEVYLHLRTLNSYWLRHDLTVIDKLQRFGREYAYGLSPKYWYWPDNTRDLVRHQMKGWGYIWLPTLPLGALGLGICLRKIASPAHRAIVLAALAAPVGGAIVAVGVTRVLIFVVPAALLTAIGLESVLALVARRMRYEVVAVLTFAVLAAANVHLLRSALNDGPTWYTNYGLFGMQYGAPQIADAVDEELAASPGTHVVISPNWTNGGDVVFRFLLHDDPRVRLDSLDLYRERKLSLSDDLLFVLPKEEYTNAAVAPSFDVRVERVLPYPDGTDGFYFVRARYSALAGIIAQLEREERRKPVTENVVIGGEEVVVTHSRFDGGSAQALFDGDTFTVARTQEANPGLYDLTFPSAHAFRGLRLVMGSHKFAVTVRLYEDADSPAVATYTQQYPDPGPDPTVELTFPDAPAGVRKVSIEIQVPTPGFDGHLHVREMKLLE